MLLYLFIALNNLIITYVSHLSLCISSSILYLYIILYLCLVLIGLGVDVGWGRLGVCGSAVVLLLWRLGSFGAVVFGNTAELGPRGFR